MMYRIELAKQTGGKAGKGNNRTSTVQVRQVFDGGYAVAKQFRFVVGSQESLRMAIKKAQAWVTERGE